MIATPGQGEQAHAEVEGGDMHPTKERKVHKPTDELSPFGRRMSILGTPSPGPWDFSL